MSEEKTKAILIMDMPSRCADCPVCHIVDGNALCQPEIRATSVQGRLTATYTKPDWCPLRKVPEKKDENMKDDWMYNIAYKKGYNACIDKILGGAI